MRNSAFIVAQNGLLGYPVGKQIQLSKDWERLLAERQ